MKKKTIMKIETTYQAVDALFNMAREFKAYLPSTAPEGDAHPEHYGKLFMRPVNEELFQCAVRANKARLIRVTFDGPIGTEMCKIFTAAQAIKEFSALAIGDLPFDAWENVYVDPESWARWGMADKLTQDASVAIWQALDTLFADELHYHTIDPVDLDLTQVAECIKGVSHFINAVPAQTMRKGSRMGRYGFIENTSRYCKVAGGCEHILAEAICAPLSPVQAIKL